MRWLHEVGGRLRGGLGPLVAALRRGGPRARRVPAPSAANIATVLEAFQREMGFHFSDGALLRQALTHRSFLGSNGASQTLSNERIEFLGDAVLELTVIEFLYGRFPDDREGSLTKKKGLLVSREVLAQCADRMRLGDYVLLSEAEREAGGSARSSILSDTFEAVIGAIYLDGGLAEARRFAQERLLRFAGDILRDESLSNHKSILQERVQARFKTHPRYRVVSETGPDHRKVFSVEVAMRGKLLGRGVGHNKKEAEQMAARDALARLDTDEEGIGGS